MEESSRRALWLRHDDVFAHDVPGHPERPARIRALEAEMSAHGWFGARAGARRRRSSARVLELVHPASYVDSIEALCAAGGGRDRRRHVRGARGPTGPRCGPRAARSQLVDALLGGEADVGVSALRPPGHHAEAARAMGFCFFGNAAVAARRATSAHGLSRVMIVDWDVHHGNGTNDIFHADSDVLFVSIHESPLYPGTGPASRRRDRARARASP